MPDRLDPQDDMVVGAGDQADEAFAASMLMARPFAVKGQMPMMTCRPLERASSGESPAEMISGSVKQMAGMATLSNARLFRR